VVVAGEQRVRAVGTRFTVHRGPRGTTVSVFEGLVAIEGSSPGARPELARLAAGDSILLSANRVADRDKVTVSELRAPWLDGYLEFQDERLDRVIFDANRFGTGSIILADPALAEIRVTAVFKSGDLEKLARNLALIIPVDVSHGENGQIILKKRS
jgi:transmembrane sensor